MDYHLSEQEIKDRFHSLYYTRCGLEWSSEKNTFVGIGATYLGLPVQKNPMDLWIYQEILHQCRPDLILECGTCSGGTTLFLAHILDHLGCGRIWSVDRDNRLSSVPQHDLIDYFTCDSLDPMFVKRFKDYQTHHNRSCMVILDDDHSEEHVLQELLTYADCVTVGQYMIVEDTNISGHPIGSKSESDPFEAVQRFLKEDPRFQADREREKFMLTFNPYGFLKRYL